MYPSKEPNGAQYASLPALLRELHAGRCDAWGQVTSHIAYRADGMLEVVWKEDGVEKRTPTGLRVLHISRDYISVTHVGPQA